ncbi:MAG: phage integrase family protein [Bacilli bacterium]|nr:phage integrase family protein [Bacilli bacterium]
MSENTIYEYIGAINRFGIWFEELTGQSLNISLLKESDPLDYRTYLVHTKKLVPKTINKNLSAIRKWLNMYRRKGAWQYDIKIPDIKEQKKLRAPKWLEPEAIAAILYAISQEKNDFLQARDRCILYFELYRGIRIGESTDLQMDDVILTQGKQRVIIREGKGNKYAEIDINGSRKLIGAIQEWISIRSKSRFASSPFFFISTRSGEVTNGAVEKMVDRIRKRSHVIFTTHQLRHTFIHDYERETKDLRLTHEAARHTDINTTLLYTQPTQKEVSAFYQILENKY